jgi:hypothetical protein
MVKQRRTKMRRTKGKKSQRGGGYSFSGHAVAPEAPYANTVVGGTPLTPDCLAASRPGMVGPVQGSGGLPGFAGGGNNSGILYNGLLNKNGGVRMPLGSEGPGAPVMTGGVRMPLGSEGLGSHVMRGGRYTVDVGVGPITGSAGPGLGGYAAISRIGCEGGLVNTSPPGALANPMPLQSGGVGGVDSAFYTAPTAGYGNRASDYVDSVGAPVLTQQPYDARIANPACNKTGGSRRVKKSKRNSRKTRRSNKNRK